MLRIFFILTLACAMASAQTAAPHKKKTGKLPKPDLAKQRALAIPRGAPVEVNVAGKGKVKGVLDGMTNDGISLRGGSDSGANATAQSIPFDQILGLKRKGRAPAKLSSPNLLNAKFDGVPEGAPVSLKLAGGKPPVSGRFAGKTPDGVKIQVPEAGGAMSMRTIPNAEIAGIKQPRGPMAKLPGMPPLQSPAMVRKSLSAVPVGSPVALNMPGGGLLSGKLAGLTADGFSLQTLEGGNLVNKDMKFDQVASVKPPGLGLRGRIPGLRRPGLQTPELLKSKAMAIPLGSPLTVTMPGGEQSTGKLTGVNNDGLQLQRMEGGNLVTQNLGFDQIGSFKQGLPVTPASRLKRASRSMVTVVVTAAITGLISGVIAK